MNKEKNIQTFIGCDSDFKAANIVLFGAPFDGTTTYRPGARFAPAKMRCESYGIETYSPIQNKDLADVKIFDAGDLELPFGNTVRALKMIQDTTAGILQSGKTPIMLGGEHLVTLGAFRAAHAVYPDICAVHFDAHADLRENYLGEELSHSTVIRRAYDLIGKNRIHQVGIRSGERAEFDFIKANIQKELKAFAGKPVYLTVDLDVLDPSEFPGTGTPEAGGMTYNSLLAAVREVFNCADVVACDIVELSPPYDPSGISTALACKFLREVLLLCQKH